MRITDQWFDRDFISTYEKGVSDSKKNWYEHEVNIPSLLSMIPSGVGSIHDYGCGTGTTAGFMLGKFKKVSVSDISEPVLKIAKKNLPGVELFIWDASKSPAPKKEAYDCVFSRLVLQFIEDIDNWSRNIYSAVAPGGSLIISVPHPVQSAHRSKERYFAEGVYIEPIGRFGADASFLHRSLAGYINPILGAGFRLDELLEPQPSQKIIRTHKLDDSYVNWPKRLNLRFAK